MKSGLIKVALLLQLLHGHFIGLAGNIIVMNNPGQKKVVFGNERLMLTLDYNKKCTVTRVDVLQQNVISSASGIFSEIITENDTFSTLRLISVPQVSTTQNEVMVSGIIYGNEANPLTEHWKFTIHDSDIVLDIERTLKKDLTVAEVSFPAFRFNTIQTWNGAFLGNGGVAWFYLFNEKRCTYGVHTSYSAFWNNKTNIGLQINASAKGKQLASKYCRSNEDNLVYSISVSEKELVPRYDADTKRRRFIRERTDVWDSFVIKAGKHTQTITLAPSDYHKTYSRGKFAGIDGEQVARLLNTIARIGVIDSKHFGANSWHTPYGPICLHEQYIAQLGIAINDSNYIKGYKDCLDFYRDNALKPDGRVFPRWAYDNSDMMPGEVTPSGFYEAQWGYLLDSNTDLTINVCELFHLSGDLEWVRAHKKSCEKSLEYLLKRDENNNGVVEMMSDAHTDKKSSDWIDIIWASWENAFVNAKLYYALTLWSEVEMLLGDPEKSLYYADFAAKLKKTFNKTIENGGFWDNKNKWYVYWRDKDNSIHGNNLVTPVNFMAIAYGICDYPGRRNAILRKIEQQMTMERLFFWPISMYPYQTDEGLDYQFPFPNYENGDLFLSWGGVGVESYATMDPDLALKYVENVLAQYAQDGLAFQRYSRINQKGEGDDILAGNCLAVVGLYRALYGINPRYNRLYLNPHLPAKLSGTELSYCFRNKNLKIKLETGNFSISNEQFKVSSKTDFGFYTDNQTLFYFNANDHDFSIAAKVEKHANLALEIQTCASDEVTWRQLASGKQNEILYQIAHLYKNSTYQVEIDKKIIFTLMSDPQGKINFKYKPSGNINFFKITGTFQREANDKNNAPGKHIVNAEYKTGYSKYDAGGNGGLYDGERGTANFRDGSWQGFEGADMEVTFELATLQKVNKVTAGFLDSNKDWIYLPAFFEIYTSVNGIDFQKACALTNAEIREFPEDEIKNVSMPLKGIEAKYVKIFAKNMHSDPAFDPIPGGKEWIFCDEIMIE